MKNKFRKAWVFVAGRRAISLFLCIGLLLTGCTPAASEKRGQEETGLVSVSTSPDLSYEVPVSTPHILADQIGYPALGEKIVIFSEKNLPDTFDVIDAETGKTVFSQKVEKQETDVGYGDFSDWTEEGTYYIQCSTLGRSYDFRIAQDVYDTLFENVIAGFGKRQEKKINVFLPTQAAEEKILQGGWYTDDEGNQDMQTAAEAMMVMLLACELYPSAFNKDAAGEEPEILKHLRRQTEWMQLLQEEKTGGVYGGILVDSDKTPAVYRMEEVDLESSAAFAAALAKFSYVYKKYDQEYAAQCLRASDRAWKYIKNRQNTATEEQQAILFCAAAELYRASGQSTYHLSLKQALDAGAAPGESFWDTFGCLTYLSTRQYVNVECCSKIMKQLMSYAEDISGRAREAAYFVEGNADFTNTDELLWNMVILSMADYVITNHEYATVIKNHQHYFLGRNPRAICLVQDEGCDCPGEAGSSIQDDLKQSAYYLCMLSQMMKEER